MIAGFLFNFSGGRGILTLGTVASITVQQTVPSDHSGTIPFALVIHVSQIVKLRSSTRSPFILISIHGQE